MRTRRLMTKGIVLAAALVLLPCALIGQSPAWVETIYTQRWSMWVGRILSWATHWVPFSIAEALVSACSIIALALILKRLLAAIRKDMTWKECFLGGAWRATLLAITIATLFYATWGLNYRRANLVTRQGWEAQRDMVMSPEERVTELTGLCDHLVAETNQAYETLHGGHDAGTPTTVDLTDNALQDPLDASYAALQDAYDFDNALGARHGHAKGIALSFIMTRLNIGGFYFPFTGEANYNRMIPACMLPHTIAHEKAHQRGVASEDEANFLGILACAQSDDPLARYSGLLFAQRQLLSELIPLNAERAKSMVLARHPGVQRDVDDLLAFWAQHDGVAARVGERVNDTYLKAQGEAEGVRSYQRSSELLITFSRIQVGTFLTDAPESQNSD